MLLPKTTVYGVALNVYPSVLDVDGWMKVPFSTPGPEYVKALTGPVVL